MKNSKHKNIPDNKITTILLIFIIGFILFFYITIKHFNKVSEKSARATSATEIPMTLITSKYGELGGAIYYDRNCYISSDSKLIGNDPLSKDIWDNYSFKKNDPPPRYTLFYLKTPYSLYKEKDNDTIIVIKDGFELKFLLESNE